MFSVLKKWATMASVIAALVSTIGVVTTVSPAEARPWYAKFDGVDGSSKQSATPQRTIKSAGRQVCCSIPRKGLALTKLLQCRKLKGSVVPLKKCGQAGAKASDAYFVKVDSETTTQNSTGGSMAEIETTQSGDDEPK